MLKFDTELILVLITITQTPRFILELVSERQFSLAVLSLFKMCPYYFSVTDDLKNLVIKLETRVAQLEKGGSKPSAAPAKVEEEDDDDDDVDLFGSDSDDEESKAEKVFYL